MMVLIFISEMILGGLLRVLVGPRVSQWWPYAAGRRTHGIDRLVELCQALLPQRGQEYHLRLSGIPLSLALSGTYRTQMGGAQ